MKEVIYNQVLKVTLWILLLTPGIVRCSQPSLESLLDVWTPYKERERWHNYNSTEIVQIDQPCMDQIDVYLEALEDGKFWAVQASDATGRYSSGLLSGNEFGVGSRMQCKEAGDTFSRQNNSTSFQFGFYTVLVSTPISFSPSPSNHNFYLGLCLPRICSAHDVLHLLLSARSRTNFTQIKVRAVTENYQYWKDPTYSLLLWTCIIVGVLMMVGTSYDLLIYKPSIAWESNLAKIGMNGLKTLSTDILLKQDHLAGIALDVAVPKCLAKSADFNDDSRSKNEINKSSLQVRNFHTRVCLLSQNTILSKVSSILSEVLLAFSVSRNVAKICSFQVGEDTLAPLHGLRFLSMLWVVLVHTCLVIFQVADNKSFRSKAEDEFLYQTLSSGSHSVDTFFFISGTLVSFLYFRTCAKFTMKEMTNTDGEFRGGVIQFLTMLGYRFIRLTPPYLITLWIVELQMKHFRDHAVLELPSLDHVNCPQYWWRNIFYINTLFPVSERCVIWSWYLADDSQFFLVGIIILIVAIKFFKVAAGSLIFLLASSWIITAGITIQSQYIPSAKDPFAHYDSLYEKPWTRVGPYLIGMATGWYLFRTKKPFSLRKPIVHLGWILTTTVMLSIIYGLYYIKLSPLSSAVYVALSHTVWALGLSWILVMCVTNNGGVLNKILSFKYIYPLSRLTYCAYLIHPQIMRSTVLSSDSNTHISVQGVAVWFMGFVLMSYLIAFGTSLAFEAPFVSLLKVAHPIRRKTVTNT